MKEDMEQIPYKKAFIYLTLTILVLTVLVLLVKLSPLFGYVIFFVKNLFLPFFIALILSYLLHPIVTMLHNRGVPRSLAVLLIYIIFFGSLTIIIINGIPVLLNQIKDLTEHIPDIIEKFELWVDRIKNVNSNPFPNTLQDGIDNALKNLEKKISDGAGNVFDWIGNTLGVLFTIVLVPFVAFYFLKDYKILEKTIITFVPRKNRREIIRLARDIDEALGNYIRGQLLVCGIIGVLAYIGYLIIGLPYSLVLASIVAITNIIPYIGPFIGAAPALVVAISISWRMALFTLIVNLLIQMIEGNIVSPQVVGRKLHIHPLFIIFALLVGGQLAGILGLILAVPIFAILKVIIQHIGAYYFNR